ncbi:HAD family hydrolase [Rhodococcus kronopolitis]|uniref:HAD family hydrolase n=1 Tax=Rhodococcus kronopolitis TaxID=1460226 RepID=A0ABV9FT86_9NOCA
MTVLIATDLDRTMIYSHSAIELGGPSATEPVLRCVEHYDGSPLSFVTETGAALLRELTTVATVVPTTTRTVAQFERIALPGAPWRYAITSNGGNILVDGVPDPQWRSQIDTSIRSDGATLDEVTAELRTRVSDDWVRTFRTADELFCYLVVEPDAVPAGFLAQWHRWCRERGWGASQQGRKIYTMPAPVSKGRAVAEVRARLVADGTLAADSLLLAAGDGALDADMLVAAHAAIRPRHGELESLNWQYPSVSVTESAGIAAGEEILRWFARNLATAPDLLDTPTVRVHRA